MCVFLNPGPPSSNHGSQLPEGFGRLCSFWGTPPLPRLLERGCPFQGRLKDKVPHHRSGDRDHRPADEMDDRAQNRLSNSRGFRDLGNRFPKMGGIPSWFPLKPSMSTVPSFWGNHPFLISGYPPSGLPSENQPRLASKKKNDALREITINLKTREPRYQANPLLRVAAKKYRHAFWLATNGRPKKVCKVQALSE